MKAFLFLIVSHLLAGQAVPTISSIEEGFIRLGGDLGCAFVLLWVGIVRWVINSSSNSSTSIEVIALRRGASQILRGQGKGEYYEQETDGFASHEAPKAIKEHDEWKCGFGRPLAE